MGEPQAGDGRSRRRPRLQLLIPRLARGDFGWSRSKIAAQACSFPQVRVIGSLRRRKGRFPGDGGLGPVGVRLGEALLSSPSARHLHLIPGPTSCLPRCERARSGRKAILSWRGEQTPVPRRAPGAGRRRGTALEGAPQSQRRPRREERWGRCRSVASFRSQTQCSCPRPCVTRAVCTSSCKHCIQYTE